MLLSVHFCYKVNDAEWGSQFISFKTQQWSNLFQVYDNRFVVPHNAYLSLKFNAHINLEVCSLIHAVKYLYKYVYKGIDRASLKLKQTTQAANNEPVDEIRAHLDTRFICAPEAIHRIFEFETQKKSDTVYRLQVIFRNYFK